MKAWIRAADAGVLGPERCQGDRAVLFERSDPTVGTYVLREGFVELSQRSAEGASVVVKILVGPTLFGQIEVLGREAEYLENARVVGSATYHVLDNQEFESLVSTQAELAFECLVDLSRAFCVTARYEPARLFATETLLANLLVSYGMIMGQEVADGLRIELRRSQADLADAIGAGERSVNRILADWKSAGYVAKRGGRYLLRDVEFLRERAGELLGSLVHSNVAT